jgi:long-chain fatty acid transport protein
VAHGNILRAALAIACFVFTANVAQAQPFGTELHNTLMPASGGMGGVSIARPQDLVSAVNGNPATLRQFRGTQFHFGGAWSDVTFDMTQTSNIPVAGPSLIQPYSATSSAPGTPAGNFGVTQDFSALGRSATLGLGFVVSSGGFADFREVPASGGTNMGSTIFNLPVALGVDVTERFSIGASGSLGIAFFDAPYVRHSGMTPDYALRGTLGANFEATEATTIGAYYQTRQPFQFDNALLFNPILFAGQATFDVDMDLPQNIGFGIANSRLMDGRLLLGVDVLYKLWEQASLYKAVYDNQWVVQFGSQYSIGRLKLRSGYVWAQNPIDQTPDVNVGGVTLGDLAAVRYTQGLLAITSQHRITAGVGITDLLPGVDFDMMAGGMFRDSEQLGPFTSTAISGYWLGAGLTWRFSRGSCCPTGAPHTW